MKKILFGSLLFLSTYVQAMTWGQMRTEVRLHIKDTSTTRQRYTDTQLNNMLQAAYRDIVTIARPTVNQIAVTLLNGTTCYTLDVPLLDIKRVRLQNRYLTETSIEELNSKVGPSWRVVGGVPISYYNPDIRITSVCFYPFPNSSASTGTVVLDIYQGVGVNETLSDSDEPLGSNNYRFENYHDVFIWRVVANVYLIEGEIEKFQYYQNIYESRLAVLKNNIWTKENYLPGFSGGTSR